MFLLPSPVEPFRFEGRDFHVKRDDLIHPDFSGNKFRKLQTLLDMPPETFSTLVSHGGVQSNAMLSLAALCRHKGWRFEYLCKSVPSRLKRKPSGNYRRALELGMLPFEATPPEYPQAVERFRAAAAKRDCCFIPQGGAAPTARAGVERLAEEIRMWASDAGVKRLNVVTPSGTGTTAACLAAALPEFTVVTTPAVGESGYLKAQISRLIPLPENLKILVTKTAYRFGTPHPDLLRMYRRLKESGIGFDLLYAPVMWTALTENIGDLGGEILYVHSGGVSGNETMLERYRYRGLISGEGE